jgi:hypothetical protein
VKTTGDGVAPGSQLELLLKQQFGQPPRLSLSEE